MLPDADRMERALARGALTGLFIGIEDLLADTDGLQEFKAKFTNPLRDILGSEYYK